MKFVLGWRNPDNLKEKLLNPHMIIESSPNEDWHDRKTKFIMTHLPKEVWYLKLDHLRRFVWERRITDKRQWPPPSKEETETALLERIRREVNAR